MGQSTSTNTGISNVHSHIKGTVNDGGVSLQGAPVFRSALPPKTSTGPWCCQAMNTTGMPVRVYLHNNQLQLCDLTKQEGHDVFFVEKGDVPFKLIPPRGHDTLEIKEEFASVFVQNSSDPRRVYKTVCVSVQIPHGRSFILTKDYQIKLQKQGAENMWMDEDGTDHSSK